MFTVHVRVTDAGTGKPIPARLRLHAADRDIAPLGRERLPPGATHHSIDGGCEAKLPAGPVRIEASRGPEWRPESREVILAQGQMSLRLSLERILDWRERGWYPGDTRAVGMSPHAARLEGRAEGLSVVHLLARDADPNLFAFSGAQPALPDDECLVAVNTLNVHPVLGTVALLNSHRPVFPLAAGEGQEWSVRDWVGQCHRKKGLAVWRGAGGQGEALACLILGEVDAFEVAPGLAAWPLYERLLRCGVRAPLVAGGGKNALGELRTYSLCPDGLTLPAWAEGVRGGRTFITNGPLLDFSHHEGLVRAEAHSIVPFDRLETLSAGDVVAAAPSSFDGPHGTYSAHLEWPFAPESTTWLAARCTGPGVLAHTSPLWIDVPGRPWQAPPDDADALRETLDEAAAYAAGLPDKGRDALRQTITSALAALEARR